MEYLYITLAALLPILVAVIFELLEKYTKFNKLNYWIKQVIFGLVFGALAIVGTHWSIPFGTANANARDASVIIAGLMFGWPAGIISGLIGGIERCVGVYWFGLPSFTQVACTVATIIAGFASAGVRKVMFDDKRCKINSALFLSFAIEVFHLLLVFLTHLDDQINTYNIMKSCTAPMLIANTISAAIATWLVKFIEEGKKLYIKPDIHKLSSKITFRLGSLIALAFVLTTTFIYIYENNTCFSRTQEKLKSATQDVALIIENPIASEKSYEEIYEAIDISTSYKHIGEKGYVVVYNEKLEAIRTRDDLNYDVLEKNFKNEILNKQHTDDTYVVNVLDQDFYVHSQSIYSYTIVAYMDYEEAQISKSVSIYINTFLQIVIYGLIFIMTSFIQKYHVNSRLNKINKGLKDITDGNLATVIEGGDTTDFVSLANGINVTVDSLKDYIDQANKRIDDELRFAKTIQYNVLPSTFPAFPDRKEFDIYASMHTAKDVGGDFYDFYFSKTGLFHFSIADVSGKGIAAALFMMRAKQVLKSITQTNIPMDEVFFNANNNLCDGNEAGLFVTAWSTTVDLNTGEMHFANAGHNPPLIKHKNGNFTYLKSKPNLVLAGMSGVKYTDNIEQLEPGDIVYLYTDGVTEAKNDHGELYGEDRLINILNSKEFETCKDLCDFVYGELQKFVKDAPQFDDITMVAFKYLGKQED